MPPFPVHAGPDSVLFQETGEGLAGELATLVGVEDLWRSLAQRFLQCLDLTQRVI